VPPRAILIKPARPVRNSQTDAGKGTADTTSTLTICPEEPLTIAQSSDRPEPASSLNTRVLKPPVMESANNKSYVFPRPQL